MEFSKEPISSFNEDDNECTLRVIQERISIKRTKTFTQL